MKLLVNDKEIAHFLVSLLDLHDAVKDVVYTEFETAVAIKYVIDERGKSKFKLDRMRDKLKDKLRKGISKDLHEYVDKVNNSIENRKKYYFNHIHKNLDFFVKALGEEKIFDLYQKSKKEYFIKTVGNYIDPKATMIRRKNFNNSSDSCLLRNTVGNEELLVSKIDNKYPFWFIDSGYTNFLEPNKKWHRLVCNHLHHSTLIDAPVDRLGNFTTFPRQWRDGGEKILVIEPGNFAAAIFHVDINQWKYDVEKELRKYTDKPIVFREKAPKKKRAKLYDHLLTEDYYCVVSINSNAATEAVWAGIPVITLDKHITNPIARDKLSHINNLYRPNLANWLCSLSYSQFTFEELMDGTAVRLMKKYHGQD